jgi:PhnB protein
MKTADPYLYFNGNTEEAFNFYSTIFNTQVTDTLRYGDIDGNPMEVDEQDFDKIAHISLPLGKNILMGTDVIESMNEKLTIGNNFYITLSTDSSEEAETVFSSLSDGGSVQVPLKKEFWAEKFGICTDRFGIQWMVNYEGDAAS